MADITRNTWIEKSSEQTVKAAENLIRLFAERSSKDYQPSYTNSYIGLRLDGKPCNFFVIIPQKKAIKLSVKVEQTSDNTNCLKQVAAKDIDYTNGWYNVSIEPEADCNDVIQVLLQAEAEFKGAPAINENEICEAQRGETSNAYETILKQLEGRKLIYVPTSELNEDGCYLDEIAMECLYDAYSQINSPIGDYENGEISCYEECNKVDLSKDGVYFNPKTYDAVAILGGQIISALCNEGETLQIGDQEFDVNEL